MKQERQFWQASAFRNAEKPRLSQAAIAAILLAVSLTCSCSRPPNSADDSSANSGTQKLPFDRQPRSSDVGVSPHQSLIPSATQLPEGTAIPVRLQKALSSAWSGTGDTFSATLDEPLVIDGQTLVGRGTTATGRVLEASPSRNAFEPGYLRIVLVSLNVNGRPVTIETSSIFAKGGAKEERKQPSGAPPGARQKGGDRDIVFGTDRRLSFRLAQTVELQ
jgi:hypothetical protein